MTNIFMQDAYEIIEKMPRQEYKNRKKLFSQNSTCGYTNDGELSDASVFPFIDYIRDPIEDIHRKLKIRKENPVEINN